MTSIKLKDDVGNWVVFGGTTTVDDLIWIPVTSSTQIVPATGGYYSIAATNDRGYVFIILPDTPANGTIAGVQVTDNPVTFTYLQPSGTDTIDYQSNPILARSSGQSIERVRYYNGKWFRLDGSYGYVPPPLVGPYLLSPTFADIPTALVSISVQTATSGTEVRASISNQITLSIIEVVEVRIGTLNELVII